MALVYTQDDLNALKEALVTGAMEVRVGDRTIKYRSQAEILQAIELIQSQLDTNSSETSPAIVQASYSRD